VSSKDVDGIALWNVNLSPWGRYRYTGDDISGWLSTAPNAIGSLTNVTGVVGNVDEHISSPDSSYLQPTTGDPWGFTADFATPAVAPQPGTDRAAWVLRVVLTGTPLTIYPRITVATKVGAQTATARWKAVTSTAATGQIFIFPFDPSALGAASDGSDLQMVFTGEPGDNASGCKVEAMRLYTGTATPSADTGMLASPTGNYSDEDGPQPSIGLPYWAPSTWQDVESVNLIVLDDQAEVDPDRGIASAGVPIANVSQLPTGYVQAGNAQAGPAVFLSRGVRHGSGPLTRIIIEERGGVTEGGQTYATDAFRRRGLSMDVLVTQDELLILQNRLPWRRGHSGVIFFSADPDLPAARQQFLSFLATVREMGDGMPMPVRYASDGTMLHTVTLSLEEKL
jgi:hypothetical protein